MDSVPQSVAISVPSTTTFWHMLRVDTREVSSITSSTDVLAGRSWSMGGGTDYDGFFAGRLDIRNNVVYNFGSRVNDGGVHQANFVGNLYKRGPASNLTYAMKAQVSTTAPSRMQVLTQQVVRGSTSRNTAIPLCWKLNARRLYSRLCPIRR